VYFSCNHFKARFYWKKGIRIADDLRGIKKHIRRNVINQTKANFKENFSKSNPVKNTRPLLQLPSQYNNEC
jgi:hypothetical protein